MRTRDALKSLHNYKVVVVVGGGGGGGLPPEKFGGSVRPASQKPYSIYDQNLQYSLPYLWPD